MKLTATQKRMLSTLHAAQGHIRKSGTNSTLCALEKRGLAQLDYIPRYPRPRMSPHVKGVTVSVWSITDAGREAIKPKAKTA